MNNFTALSSRPEINLRANEENPAEADWECRARILVQFSGLASISPEIDFRAGQCDQRSPLKYPFTNG